MFEWSVKDRQFLIREAAADTDYRSVEEVQREVWQCSDLDIVGSLNLIASQHAGAILLCAFEGEEMIGFTYGFPALDKGRVSIHSHMAAVRDHWRGREYQVGFYLKRLQREAALARGLQHITWTFDPLQSLNAYFNFGKLGVVCKRYFVNFYGDASTSPLHQGFGTDRLWVDWHLESERVKGCVGRAKTEDSATRKAATKLDANAVLLVRRAGDRPVLTEDLSAKLSASECYLEIPPNINALKAGDANLGRLWREATRKAFLEALEAGFTISDFVKVEDGETLRWFYQLRR
jgi:predicted GNAT superfamily acetyltransferase